MASKKDIYSEIKESIFKINNKTENTSETLVTDTELHKLNIQIKSLKTKFLSIEDKFNSLVENHQKILNGLIGSVIIKYYIEIAHKYSKKLKKIADKIVLLNSENTTNIIDEALYRQSNEYDNNSVLKNLSSIFEQISSEIKQVEAVLDSETGTVKVYDTGSSKFYYTSECKSVWVKITDVSGPNIYSYVGIYGDKKAGNSSDGSDAPIYLTSPDLSLTNVKLVPIKREIKIKIPIIFLLPPLKWTRVEYVGVVQDKADPTNIYGITISFKKNMFGKYDKSFFDDVKRVKICKGYYIDGIFYLNNDDIDNYGKIYNRFRSDINDGESFSEDKFLNYITNYPYNSGKINYYPAQMTGFDEDVLEDHNKKPKDIKIDSNPIIRLVAQDDEQEDVKIGRYKHKIQEYLVNETTNTSIELDRETLDWTNENKLCDYALVSFTNNKFNIKNLQFDANGSEKDNNGKITYKFQASYSPSSNSAEGTLGNSIPLSLLITSESVNNDTQTIPNKTLSIHKIKINISFDESQTIMIQPKDDYLYGEMGGYFAYNKLQDASSLVSDVTSDPDYMLIYIKTILSKESPSMKDLALVKSFIGNILDGFILDLLNYVKIVYKSLMTPSVCDPIRKSYDPSYDDSFYSNIKDSITMTANSMETLTNLTKVSEVINNLKNITELYNSITLHESNINQLVYELITMEYYLNEMIDSYSCFFKFNSIDTKVKNSMSYAASIYEGTSNFDEVLALSGDMFLPFSAGLFSYDSWREEIGEYVKESNITLVKYYLINIILGKLSEYNLDNIKTYSESISRILLSFIKRYSIQSSLIPVTLSELLKEETAFNLTYSMKIMPNYQGEKISSLVSYKYPFLSFINEINLEFEKINDKYCLLPELKNIIKSKLLTHILKDPQQFQDCFDEIYENLTKSKNLRSIILLQCFKEINEFLNEKDSTKFSLYDFETFSLKSESKTYLDCIHEYIVLYNKIYNSAYIIQQFLEQDIPSEFKDILGLVQIG